jgi:hypothetical protein
MRVALLVSSENRRKNCFVTPIARRSEKDGSLIREPLSRCLEITELI